MSEWQTRRHGWIGRAAHDDKRTKGLERDNVKRCRVWFFLVCEMELDYAFLAERADRLHDNRLVVFGGDSDTIEAERLPALIQLNLVARFLLAPDEPLEGHGFAIEITNARGERKKAAEGQLNTARDELEPDHPSGASLIVNTVLKIGNAGTILIHLIVDGREVKTLRLRVRATNPPDTEDTHGLPNQISAEPNPNTGN